MLKKFATQIDADVIEQLKILAHKDGRQIQYLIGEALKDYIIKRIQGKARPSILQNLQQHQTLFKSVYETLSDRP